jgi:hypothetical protein
LSTYRLLPPSHQTYWYFIHSYIRVVCIYRAELEVIRKAASVDDQLYNYAADPFVVSEAKMKAAQEKEKLEREESERENRLMAREAPWVSLPVVIMSSEAKNIAVLIFFSDSDPPSYLINQLRSVISMMQRTQFP